MAWAYTKKDEYEAALEVERKCDADLLQFVEDMEL